MSLVDIKGNPISGGAGYSVIPKNIADKNNPLNLYGYHWGWGPVWQWLEDETKVSICVKLNAGVTYYIATNGGDYKAYTEPCTIGDSGVVVNGEEVTVTADTENKVKYVFDSDCYLYLPCDISAINVIVTTDHNAIPETTKGAVAEGWYTTNNPFSGRDVGLLWSDDIGQETITAQDFSDGIQMAQNVDNTLTNSDFVLGVFGDSIVYGASNVGLGNTYHVRLIDKFNVQYWWRTTSGTTATDGYGMEWTNGSTKYGTGYTGFKSYIESFGAEQALTVFFGRLKMAMLAIGTNDFGNSAPLGTFGNGDTATFYGGYQAYIDLIRKYNPDLPIILVIPFKRSNWNEANEQGYTLPEYNYAIYDIAHRYKGVYVLDVFDCWWGNYDNTNIAQGGKSSMFLDGVHPNERFHRIMAVKLEEKVKEVIQQEGIILHKIP